MELRHLRYFAAVAESLNFTRAAEKLRVAQPALSRQIQALENELGTKLLDRNRQRVLLTDAGQLFLDHSRKILAQVDIATLAVREVDTGAAGELRIAHDWRLPAGLVSNAVAEYRRQFPRVEIALRDLQMTEQLVALHARKIHLGFVATVLLGPDQQLASRPLIHTDIVALVPASHPLAGRGSVRLAELKNEEWITVATADNGYRSFLLQDCRNAGFTPRFSRATANQPPAVVGLIGAGMGVALIPRLALPAEPAGVAVLGTDCDPIDICAVWNEQDQSPLLRNFVAILGQMPQ
jgi:LysR family transcriptional regulator, benzoate and cis,cis-muconate-responsive activator of ben and cat genes